MFLKTVKKNRDDEAVHTVSGEIARNGTVDIISGYGIVLFGYPLWLSVKSVNTYKEDNAPDAPLVKRPPRVGRRVLSLIDDKPAYYKAIVYVMLVVEIGLLIFMFIPVLYTLFTKMQERQLMQKYAGETSQRSKTLLNRGVTIIASLLFRLAVAIEPE